MLDEKYHIEQVNTLVKYQEDSIVSKIITDKKTGRITMFAFGKGQGISEQSLPLDSVLFITDGKAEITLEGETTLLEKDTLVLIPQNHSHEIYAIENFKMLSIVIGA